MAQHQPSIERLQQFARRSQIRHSGVEPYVVGIWRGKTCRREISRGEVAGRSVHVGGVIARTEPPQIAHVEGVGSGSLLC
jgi:hypothetical protein